MALAQMLGSPGNAYSVNGNTYQADGSGLITSYKNSTGSFTGIAAADIVWLINCGALPATQRAQEFDFDIVLAASATVIVASVAMSNGDLTIAAQPDVPRQLQFVVNPGTTAITAGTLTLTYSSNSGVTTTDVLSLAVALSTALTLTSTHGCSVLSKATVAGLVGGTSPNIQGGTNAVLALPIDAGSASVTVYKATMDDTNVTLPTQSGVDKSFITPATAPNGTHVYEYGFSFISA